MNPKPEALDETEPHLGPTLGRCGRLLLAALLLLPPHLWAATVTVDGTTCNLVDAVTAANTDLAAGGCPAGAGADTIELQTNVTLTAINTAGAGGANGLPTVTSDITVNGNGYTIDRVSNDAFRFFQVNPNASLTLNDVTLSGGQTGTGGALRNNGGSLTLINTTVSGNVANQGGGIFQGPANPAFPAGSTTLQGSVVSDNVTFLGGGVYVLAGAATLTDSTVAGNDSIQRADGSDGDGGGLYLASGTAALTNSTVSANLAQEGGGGLYVRPYATADLVNSTVSTNFAYRGGGVFSLRYGTANLTHSTISTNDAYFGASIFVWDDGGSGGFQGEASKTLLLSTGVTLVNSLVGNSTGALANCEGNIPAAIVNGGYNLDDDASCGLGAGSGALTGLDATLAANGGPTQTHALLCGSTAIDAAGDCAAELGLTTDQRGEPRPSGLACDSGSYELQDDVGGLYPIALSDATVDPADPPASGTLLIDIFNGSQSGNFGWLTWTGDPSVPVLTASLTPPGNSNTYVNPYDPADQQVSVGDYVQGSPGVSNAEDIRTLLDTLISEGTVITLPIWDLAESGGNNANYRVAGFAQVQIDSYHLPKDNMISAVFIGLVDPVCP